MTEAPHSTDAASLLPAGRHYRTTGRPLRRWPRRLLLGVNVLTALIIASSAVGVVYVIRLFGDIHRKSVTFNSGGSSGGGIVHVGTGAHTKPFTMLLVGSDTRALSKATGLSIGNSSQNSENLGDSIVLARIVPNAHRIALLSIPRDLIVSIPGVGDGKINSAYAGGNASRLVQTIEEDLHIPINHFAAVNFDTLEQIADIVGGVEQYFPTPAFDEESGLFVAHAGCQNLVGAQALAFVRSRNYFYVPRLASIQQAQTTAPPGVSPPLVADGEADLQLAPESDLGRIQRQQAFIRNTIHKAQRTGALSSPSKLLRIINSLANNLTLDSSFSDQDILNLASDFRHVDASGIPSWTYPTVNGAIGLNVVPTADAATVKQFESFASARLKPAATTTTLNSRSGGTPTTMTTLPHALISVTVENGSGTALQAGMAASDLESAGFTITGTTDSSSYGHTVNIVEHGPTGLAAAETLEASVAGGATLSLNSSLGGNNLVLITGTAFAGVAIASSTTTTATTATTAPASTTTTTAPAYGSAYASATKIVASSSSYYHDTYIPPGRVAGQRVSTCGN